MKKISIYLILVLLTFSCDEVFEDDITDAQLEILAPCDGLVTTKTTLTFMWNILDEANSYRLQVVSTSFDTILSNPVDTNLTINKFEVTLNPGKYGWRVKAMNSATETAWFTQKLTILDTPDLKEQEVFIKLPAEGDAFGNTKIKFEWTILPRATSYMLIVKEGTWGGRTIIEEITKYDTLTKVLIKDKKYVWGVKGINENSQSKYQNNTFFIDLTPPDAPTLLTPVDKSTKTGVPVILTWEDKDNLTSIEYDSIYISKTSDFKSANKIARERVVTSSFSLNTDYRGEVFWKVKSADKIGNKGVFSGYFSFTLE